MFANKYTHKEEVSSILVVHRVSPCSIFECHFHSQSTSRRKARSFFFAKTHTTTTAQHTAPSIMQQQQRGVSKRRRAAKARSSSQARAPAAVLKTLREDREEKWDEESFSNHIFKSLVSSQSQSRPNKNDDVGDGHRQLTCTNHWNERSGLLTAEEQLTPPTISVRTAMREEERSGAPLWPNLPLVASPEPLQHHQMDKVTIELQNASKFLNRHHQRSSHLKILGIRRRTPLVQLKYDPDNQRPLVAYQLQLSSSCIPNGIMAPRGLLPALPGAHPSPGRQRQPSIGSNYFCDYSSSTC